MEDFYQQFAHDAVKNLENLQENLQYAETISGSQRREIFRTLHTIKGTAQTFGYAAASRLAHELENVLSAENFLRSENFQSLFGEGIEFLIKSFEQKDFDFPAQFAERVCRVIPENLQSQMKFDIFPPEIPLDIVESLSQTEKIALGSALKFGRRVYCFEVGFDAADFADKLIGCRTDLGETGEILATFPSAEFDPNGKIGFRMLCINLAEKPQIEKIAEKYTAKIVFDILPENFTNDLHEIAAKAAAHGRNLAGKIGKDIDFKVSVEQTNVSDEKLKTVFDILIHLIRNAVDHGIKNSGGKIEISIKTKNNGLKMIVADNGSGIDSAKLKARAVEKKLISADKILTEQAALDLIFQSELSTASEITEISGRGIGLDAVKNSVEKSGGTIKVESRTGKGTIFEVFLPR